ncbi:MAG: GHKL domain-containing protein [Eubacteriales bacterium]|nr:GHKL domain-containing protein [Eubacteriales bacterium]
MSLFFRLSSAGYLYLMMALSLFVLTSNILGKKIKGGLLAVFCICAELLQWLTVGIQILLAVLNVGDSIVGSSLWDIVCYAPVAFVLGILLARSFQLPLLHTVTAAVLGTFIVNTAGSVMVQVVEAYAPLFDRRHFLVFVRLYIPYTLTFAVACLASVILRKSEFYRYFSALFCSQFRSVLTLLICFSLMCTMPVLRWIAPDTDPDVAYSAFFFVFIVAGLFLIQFTAMYAAGQDKIKAQEEMILQQQAHMALLEELQQEIRAFRHDFTNLFSGLTLQAQEGDLAGIQEFMKKTSSYFDEKLGNEISQMDGLNNIELYPLRSLIATKLAKMRQRNIKGILEALYPVRKRLSMDTDDLLRALGILLDNAMEAVPSTEGLVRVVLLQEEKELYLAVVNNYDKVPDLSALSHKGYTTKGEGHGTGLSSYRRILSRCRGCVSRTYLKDNMFIQELHIPVVQS